MSIDIVDRLRVAHQTAPIPYITSVYSQAADEIERLREELAQMNAHADAWTDTANLYATNAEWWRARAERAEVDADRLAEALRNMAEHELNASACRLCIVLDLHDREVEAR